MNIIQLKNSKSYHDVYGAVTITFFPINIPVLLFIIPIIMFKSKQLNEFVLKIQYAQMVLIYCLLAALLSICIYPLLYFKIITNAIFILLNNKR